MNPDQQLQELYFLLEHTTNGDQFMAWYGQLRAKETPHATALIATITHFRLGERDWWRNRLDGDPDRLQKLYARADGEKVSA